MADLQADKAENATDIFEEEKTALPVGDPETTDETEIKELSAEEQHKLEVAENAEESKNPDLYETYEYKISDFDSCVSMYWVRRRGRSHVLKNKPCQDYCLVEETDDCIILTGADGVSSCECSDIGAELACRTMISVIKSADKHCKSEKDFVDLLCSVRFRYKFITRWINSIKNLAGNSDPLKELARYGTTIMYVVITQNWYVCGNLGDGQILLFNDQDAVKVRVHSPKESSRVRALVNEKCYLEDFQTAVYPRSMFNGVLLSSDGMYDVLDGGTNFYSYARQIAKRFSGAKSPLQPFCYQDNGDQLKDLYRYRTQDDCSIVLALEERPTSELAARIHEEIEQYSERMVLQRAAGRKYIYGIEKDSKYKNMVASHADDTEVRDVQLSCAEIIKAADAWSRNSIRYAVYDDMNFESLELMFCNGKLREQKETTINASKYIMDLYFTLLKCSAELQKQGYVFNEAAQCLMGLDYESGRLVVCEDAISEMKYSDENPPVFWNYFESLIGVLECGDAYRPVFATGYVALGKTLARIDDNSDEPMCRVQNGKNEFMLKNISDRTWLLEDKSEVEPGMTVALTDGLIIMLPTAEPGNFAMYRYHTKENL